MKRLLWVGILLGGTAAGRTEESLGVEVAVLIPASTASDSPAFLEGVDMRVIGTPGEEEGDVDLGTSAGRDGCASRFTGEAWGLDPDYSGEGLRAVSGIRVVSPGPGLSGGIEVVVMADGRTEGTLAATTPAPGDILALRPALDLRACKDQNNRWYHKYAGTIRPARSSDPAPPAPPE